jgi:hypothetical protein
MHATAEKAPDLIARSCATCGNQYWHTPIYIGAIDLAASYPAECESCEAQREAAVALAARQARAAAIEDHIRTVIPPDLLATDPAHPDFNAALWSTVARWRPSAASLWLGIIGPAGACKTRSMALLAARAMRAGIQAAWITANDFRDASIDRNSRNSRADAERARATIDHCRLAPWLFFDDLGKNDWPASMETCFFQLLDYRKNHRLPLIYSSNASPEALGILLSDLNRDPIISRLLDRTTVINLTRKS